MGEAMLLVRPSITKVTVWSRTTRRLNAFVAKARAQYPNINISPSESPEMCVHNADIICTLTSASIKDPPVLRGAWVKRGAHINAVGACSPEMRELDTELVKKSKLFAESIDSCLREPGDIVVPLKEGHIKRCHLQATLGALLIAEQVGRPRKDDILGSCRDNVTLFESLGLAVHDLMAAVEVVENAKKDGEKECCRIRLN